MRAAGTGAVARPVPVLRSLRSLCTGTGRTQGLHSILNRPKDDISELEKTRHLCFGLTHPPPEYRGP